MWRLRQNTVSLEANSCNTVLHAKAVHNTHWILDHNSPRSPQLWPRRIRCQVDSNLDTGIRDGLVADKDIVDCCIRVDHIGIPNRVECEHPLKTSEPVDERYAAGGKNRWPSTEAVWISGEVIRADDLRILGIAGRRWDGAILTGRAAEVQFVVFTGKEHDYGKNRYYDENDDQKGSQSSFPNLAAQMSGMPDTNRSIVAPLLESVHWKEPPSRRSGSANS